MDIFEFPDDYKPEKNLTDEEAEDITNYLKNHPLFMKELPQDIESNEHLVALQALKEDEDPVEMAQDLNKQANKRLKETPQKVYHMKEAYKKYTEAIKLKCDSAATNAKLHANRAALNLKLKNYGKVVQDCKICLKYDPEYLKGYYRYGKALNALEKYEKTLQLLESRKEDQLKEIKNYAEAKIKEAKKIEEEKKNKKTLLKQEINQYCKGKKWNLLKREQPLPEGAQIKMVNGNLSLPLMVIYPEFSQFDIIASSFEKEKIRQHFKQLLEAGLPWDTKQQYKTENLQIYCEVHEAVMMAIPWQAKIGEIASRVPIRGCIEIHLVCKGNQFYKKFMESYKFI